MASRVHALAQPTICRGEGNEDALELCWCHANASVSHGHFNETFVLAIVHESLVETDDHCFDCDNAMLLEFDGVRC